MSATEPRYYPVSTLHRKLRQGTGSKGRPCATITRRLCTIAGLYKYTVEEELLAHSPAGTTVVRRWTIPLAPHTVRAIDLAIGERTGGLVFLAADGAAAGLARHLHRRRQRHRRRSGRTRSSSLRELIASLVKTLPGWYWTLRALMNSRAPISGFDRPSPASRATWTSCEVSSPVVSTVRLRAISPVASRSRLARELGSNAGAFEVRDRGSRLRPAR
jgi:hypothetical protein